MNKHTLGPWTACDDGWIAGPNGERVVSHNGCGSHAADWKPEDLKLALAAPDLLTALLDVIGWVPGGNFWHTPAPLEAMEKARAAIAKATAHE